MNRRTQKQIMVSCSCGKPIDKVPDWMQAINVQFVCNNCPNRQLKNIAFVNLDPAIPAASKAEIDDEIGEVPDLGED